jgi:DNA-binding NarL/FixJ family response regulator
MLEGLSAEQMAERDFVGLATVRTQIQSVLRKLGVGSQLAAVAAPGRAGWRPEA